MSCDLKHVELQFLCEWQLKARLVPAATTIPAPLSVVKLQHVVFMGNDKVWFLGNHFPAKR